MTIQKKLRALTLAAAMSFAAYGAYAETVTVSTYYPSPYGSYKNLITTDQTNLATTGGNVVIGAAGPGTAKLDVTGNALVTGALRATGTLTGGTLALDSGASAGTGTLSISSCDGTTCYARAVYS